MFDAKERALFDYLPAPTIPEPSKEFTKMRKLTRRQSAVLEEKLNYDLGAINIKNKYESSQDLVLLYRIYQEKRQKEGISQRLIKMLGKKTLGLFKTVDLLTAQRNKDKFFNKFTNQEHKYKFKEALNKHKTQFIKSMMSLEERRKYGYRGSLNPPKISLNEIPDSSDLGYLDEIFSPKMGRFRQQSMGGFSEVSEDPMIRSRPNPNYNNPSPHRFRPYTMNSFGE